MPDKLLNAKIEIVNAPDKIKEETEEMKEENDRIDITYGYPTIFGDFMYGAGYGKSKEITTLIHEVAKKIFKVFPNLNFVIRCNTDGKSCGIYSKEETFGISVKKVTNENKQVERNLKRKAKDGEIFFSGMVKGIVSKNVDWIYKDASYSILFTDMEDAIEWVATNFERGV